MLKIYSHLRISAKRTLALKEFSEFFDADQCNILRHVVTRWLSLLPAIERVLHFWSALKSYVQSLGEDNCIMYCGATSEKKSYVARMIFIFNFYAML